MKFFVDVPGEFTCDKQGMAQEKYGNDGKLSNIAINQLPNAYLNEINSFFLKGLTP